MSVAVDLGKRQPSEPVPGINRNKGGAPMKEKYPLSRSSFSVGNITLRNRLVFPPFETNYATPDSFPTEKHFELYGKIAAGGVGLIVMEASNVNPKIRPTKYGIGITEDAYIPFHKKLTDIIHREGAAVILQIADKSALEEGRYGTEMSEQELKEIIGYFVEAIRRAEKSGYDGIDFHAAHLYTLADFLSRYSNKRKDGYGGSLRGRVRVIEEIFLKAKELVEPNFIFACRFNGDDFIVGENTLKDATKIAQYLETLGLDLLDISAGGRIEPILKTGSYGGWESSYSASRTIPNVSYPDACNIYLAEGIKKTVKKIPVTGCGKIGTVELAEKILGENKADLVGMARAIFCDPELPNKTFEGREKEISRCNWCNVCHRLYISDKETVCAKWPGVKAKMQKIEKGAG